MKTACLALSSLLLGSLLLAEAQGEVPTRVVPLDFATEVWPILEARCIDCHGERRARAGLRLDGREAALAGSRYGRKPVILPGDAEASLLFTRVAHADPEERMPPEEDALAAAELDVLRRWIEQGAVWPEGVGSDAAPPQHWAYVAPQRPDLPASSLGNGDAHPIDTFVSARARAAGLELSAEADRATLIRRVALDVTGLPPTLAELDTFLADEEEGAYERMVERYLASPHYGEHMASWWLDLARYADSHGYEKDAGRTMWRWRDWVIDAFNEDMPFDRFTELQLAGDLLEDPSLEELVATGFHRNTMLNQEGGVDPEEFRVAAVVDRVNTTAQVWLGSTFACAQCHDHKFDPVSIEEYYRFYAYFDQSADEGDSEEPKVAAPTREDLRREPFLRAELARLTTELATHTQALTSEQMAWEARLLGEQVPWAVFIPDDATGSEGTRLAALQDHSLLALGDLPSGETYLVEGALAPGKLAALRLEVLTDQSLPNLGPGRPSHRNFVLNEFEVERITADGSVEPIELARARADFEQAGTPAWPAPDAIDGDRTSGWAIGGGVGESHQVWFTLAEPLSIGVGERLRLRLVQVYGGGHTIGRFRVATSAKAPAENAGPAGPNIERLVELGANGAVRNARDEEALAAWWRERSPVLAPARERRAELEAELRYPTALIMRERSEPRETRVLHKGNFLVPLDPVEAGLPLALITEEGPSTPTNRLGLARWLTSRANPLTSRVLVNRIWERIFGVGLVATLDDFGTQGDRPTHPELLDWMAVQFMDQGWSPKRLLFDILISRTYRQQANVLPLHQQVDPSNTWLARFPRRRVPAETVRDVALASSGLLSPTIGGPSVFPPQPEGTWAMTYSSESWQTSEGADRFRRGLYTFWRRTAPYPTYLLFDATSREIACTRRERSNTPLQALALLNDPVFVELALGLGARMLREGGESAEERVNHGWRLCVGREPTTSERTALLAHFEEERARFADDPSLVVEYLGRLGHPVQGEVDGADVELAAWAVVANVLLNLDETITRG